MTKDPEQRKAEWSAQRLMGTLAGSERDASATVRAIERTRSMSDDELIEYAEAMESPSPPIRLAARTRFDQGLPLKITDPAALARVAHILTAG